MSIRPDNFSYFALLLKQHSAIVLSANKSYLVNMRLLPLARRAKLESVDALIDRLRVSSDGRLLQDVIDAMTTNETSFFRDSAPFESLRDAVLPELVGHRSAVRTLNVWSAGCASGQEPYTIAMLWRERFPELSKTWRFRLLATDISLAMLERAEAGRYSKFEVNRGLPAEYLQRYFHKDGEHWVVNQELKAMVEFRALNLNEAWPPLPAMDVIFLRNVLVYFDISTRKRILGQIRSVLRTGGYLFLGGSETTVLLDEAYQRVASPTGSYFRLKDLRCQPPNEGAAPTHE